MSRSTAYSISVEEAEIIVRLGRDKIDPEMLSRFLDYLELETIRKRSQLTEEQAAALANDIDRVVWDNLRPSFTQEGGGADSTTGDC